MSEQLSGCHNASVTVGGDDTDPLGGTHYYVCSTCHEACDLALPADSIQSHTRQLAHPSTSRGYQLGYEAGRREAGASKGKLNLADSIPFKTLDAEL